MAVLGALYGASTPSADSLTDVQLLQVVILADMLQVTDLAEEVVATLVQAAEATQGLSEAAVQQLLSLESYPACVVSALQHITRHMQLQDTAALWAKAAAPSNPGSFEAVLAAPHSRYMQIQLLEALGDLEEVWQEDDQQQQQVLLSLPLPAMQLLLSSSALQVASEDTVLYTAQAYMDAQPSVQQQQAAQQALAGLVRCPHLSSCWILAGSRADSETQLLWPFKDTLAELSAFNLVQQPFHAEMFSLTGSTPDSWLQGRRRIVKRVPSTRVLWRLPVSQVKEACIEASAKQEGVIINSPVRTRPLCGLSFSLTLNCAPTEDSSGTHVKVGLHSVNCPHIMFYKYRAGILIGGSRTQLLQGVSRSTLPAELGLEDSLGLGPMAGGWDEAGWAEAGLPATGELEITAVIRLTICDGDNAG